MSEQHGHEMVERLTSALVPTEEELVSRLAPAPGERWLDVGTGAGAVALRAAREGADVTAIDASAPMVEQARADASAAGLAIRFDVGSLE